MAKKKKKRSIKKQAVLCLFFAGIGDFAALAYLVVIGDISILTVLGF